MAVSALPSQSCDSLFHIQYIPAYQSRRTLGDKPCRYEFTVNEKTRQIDIFTCNGLVFCFVKRPRKSDKDEELDVFYASINDPIFLQPLRDFILSAFTRLIPPVRMGAV